MKRIRVGSLVIVHDDLKNINALARVIYIDRNTEQVSCMILNDLLEDEYIVHVGTQKVKEYVKISEN